MVVDPLARFRGTGPMTGVVVPAAATETDSDPAGTISIFSFGLLRPEMTALPPASTSTAGAAAVCRTTTRAMPSGTELVGLTKGVRVGLPAAVRLATTVALAPAGSEGLAVRIGAALAGSPALRTAMAWAPAGRLIGAVTVLKVKPDRALEPST